MTVKKVERRPSRKRMAKKAAAKPVQQTTTPVVDVPTAIDDNLKISRFISENREAVKKYCKDQFGSDDKLTIDAVVRECAECVINKRTPRNDKLWANDASIIEEIIKKACKPITETAQTESEDIVRRKSTPKKVVKKAAKKPVKKAAKKVVAKKATTKKKVVAKKKAAPKKKVVAKKSAKKTAAKKTAPKKKVVAKKSAKKTTTKKVVKATEVKVDTTTLKKSKGKPQFEAALHLLKKQRKVWIQAQDIPTVASHLYAVSNGKEEMQEKIKGQGEKDYGKRRLVTMLDGIKELIAANA